VPLSHADTTVLTALSSVENVNWTGGPPFGIPQGRLHYGILNYARTSILN
jgi:hypothetical protein